MTANVLSYNHTASVFRTAVTSLPQGSCEDSQVQYSTYLDVNTRHFRGVQLVDGPAEVARPALPARGVENTHEPEVNIFLYQMFQTH
jgi:hypothetical protein